MSKVEVADDDKEYPLRIPFFFLHRPGILFPLVILFSPKGVLDHTFVISLVICSMRWACRMKFQGLYERMTPFMLVFGVVCYERAPSSSTNTKNASDRYCMRRSN